MFPVWSNHAGGGAEGDFGLVMFNTPRFRLSQGSWANPSEKTRR